MYTFLVCTQRFFFPSCFATKQRITLFGCLLPLPYQSARAEEGPTPSVDFHLSGPPGLMLDAVQRRYVVCGSQDAWLTQKTRPSLQPKVQKAKGGVVFFPQGFREGGLL